MIKLRSTNQFMFSRRFISLEHAHQVAEDQGIHAAINRKAFPFSCEPKEPRYRPNRHQRRHGLRNGYALGSLDHA